MLADMGVTAVDIPNIRVNAIFLQEKIDQLQMAAITGPEERSSFVVIRKMDVDVFTIQEELGNF